MKANWERRKVNTLRGLWRRCRVRALKPGVTQRFMGIIVANQTLLVNVVRTAFRCIEEYTAARGFRAFRAIWVVPPQFAG